MPNTTGCILLVSVMQQSCAALRCAGIVYGIYLALSSWILFYLVAKTTFFTSSIHMFDLEQREATLQRWCQGFIPTKGLSPDAPACTVPQYRFGMQNRTCGP
jgi:hypothetical protein